MPTVNALKRNPQWLKILACFVFVFILISYFILFNYSLVEQSPLWASSKSALSRKLETYEDYDSACSGYSIGRIIREQKRILESVLLELSESQAKLEDIRAIHEELQRLIPQKQLELSSLDSEIEAAQRQLEELREIQNVQVFLPFSPLKIPRINAENKTKAEHPESLDDIFDFRFCSISSFMPVSVEMISNGKAENLWNEAFREVIPNFVEDNNRACFTIFITNGIFNSSDIKNDKNCVIFNIGYPISNISINCVIVQSSLSHRNFDIAIFPTLDSSTPPSILPLSKRHTITIICPIEFENLISTVFEEKSNIMNDNINVISCKSNATYCKSISDERDRMYSSSLFCFILPSEFSVQHLMDSLKSGCIPVIFSNDRILPLPDLIDWRKACYSMPIARLPEAHFIVRSIDTADILEMRRFGRSIYVKYLSNRNAIAESIISAMRFRLQIPSFEEKTSRLNVARPLFNNSFTAPKSSIPSLQPNFDDEYLLGPLETRVHSTSYSHNFSEFQLYAYDVWNSAMSPLRTKEFLVNSHDLPSETEFNEDTRIGFRPIDPGSGLEFSRALGGNRQREQFTIVLLTFERDNVLVGAIERLHQLPYLNKVIVVWNNVHRDPPDTWPGLHVPVEFIKVAENSLNNRFVPWDRIETEAVLSLDDDIDLMQQEIILAFRVWRENRDRIVGFPARYHARYGDSMFYNSNHTCQMSIILTGAAFFHKNYMEAYTYEMPKKIREHVDMVKNCEDIAMNYLVAHLTRKPPIKTTSRWTLKCATCAERLSESDSHFSERHECMRLFTDIYGYNPLKFSQFRADSILFKTRLPQNHQKCFKYV